MFDLTAVDLLGAFTRELELCKVTSEDVSVLNDTVAQDLLKSADLVVDLTREGFIHAPVQQEILAAGTRIIFVCDAPDVLIRNLPGPGDKDRVQRGVDLLSRSSTMRVLAEGDILLPFKEFVREPVTLQVVGGHIEKVVDGRLIAD